MIGSIITLTAPNIKAMANARNLIKLVSSSSTFSWHMANSRSPVIMMDCEIVLITSFSKEMMSEMEKTIGSINPTITIEMANFLNLFRILVACFFNL